MLGKNDGRARAHRALARAGYGKGGAILASGGVASLHHDGIESHLSHLEAEVGGGSPKSRLDRKSRASGGGIHIKPSHKGLLHKDLHVAAGEKIPASELAKAKNSSDPAVRKRATFAANAKKWAK